MWDFLICDLWFNGEVWVMVDFLVIIFEGIVFFIVCVEEGLRF